MAKVQREQEASSPGRRRRQAQEQKHKAQDSHHSLDFPRWSAMRCACQVGQQTTVAARRECGEGIHSVGRREWVKDRDAVVGSCCEARRGEGQAWRGA